MPRSAEDVLEFDGLRELVRRYTTCAPGRRSVELLTPLTERTPLEAAFASIREAIAYLGAGNELGFGTLADPEPWLARLDILGTILSPEELLDAASLLDASSSPQQLLHQDRAKFPLLAARAEALADFRSLATAIHRAILPNGEISDDASSQLKRIRGSITRTREIIQKTLHQILRERGRDSGEDYITVRNDRFVVPVRSVDRHQVQGVVHGSSASGQTVFVEPLPAIELNNRLVQLIEQQASEIARILEELTAHLHQELDALKFAVATVAELDSTFARARFARHFNCTLPAFTSAQNGRGELHLQSARHPLLEDSLMGQGRSVVPMTVRLGGEETVLIISGPNTGGKTVVLKTVGLAALAAQSGIPVLAEYAELPLFDRILADIGDEQSIAADLSTFSAHILNLRAMLEAATEGSLVLADEIGTGTAPEEGSALAVALLEEFRLRRCLTLATTHQDRLKAYASTTPGVLNAAVEFDDLHLRPTYRLRVGIPGGSSGLAIARRLGLPPQVIERAKSQLDPKTEEADLLIAWLHRTRDELDELKRQSVEQLAQLEAERARLTSEWVARQRKRLTELEQRFAETLGRYEQEVARTLEAVKDRQLQAQLEKQAHRRMAKGRAAAREETNAAVVAHLADSQPDLGVVQPATEPVHFELLTPGTRVRVRGFPQPVLVRRRDSDSAEIEAGPLRMKVSLDEITSIVNDNTPASSGRSSTPSVQVHAQPSDEPSSDEINVIGCTVEEASRRVDKFLDSAALAGKPRVRVVHGHGRGALRRGLAELFAAHPLVEKFFAEAEDRGGAAVTVVVLRP